MKRDPRGYRYSLEPLRTKSGWEIQELQQSLARHNKKIGEKSHAVQQCETHLASISNEMASKLAREQIIHADQQMVVNAYLASQHNLLAGMREELRHLDSQRDDVLQQLRRMQKFSDGLDEHRGEDAKNYAKEMEKNNMVEADDAWLRSITWRASR